MGAFMLSFIKKVYYSLVFFIHIPSFVINKCSISKTTRIAKDVSIKNSTIGKYNYIARHCSLYNVSMGNYCCIGPDVHIGGAQHPYWDICMSPLICECPPVKKTLIGNDVWIGAGCIIKQGVRVGNGAVIGANSFVNKDVEDFSIVVGSPAKEKNKRFDERMVLIINNSNYWELPPQKARQELQRIKKQMITV